MKDHDTTSGSITLALSRVRQGDDEAVRHLWNRYYADLVSFARRCFGLRPRPTMDEEDVALDVLLRIVQGTRSGRFPLLTNRADLQGLFVVLTSQRVIDVIRADRARKRGNGQVATESSLVRAEADPGQGLDEGRRLTPRLDPPPDLSAVLREEYDQLLNRLGGNQELRRIAEWRFQGYSVDEIASCLNVNTRTVERRLSAIRDHWESNRSPR
jgi:RNA polymerase sigma factor (sigma-70 family)